MKTVTWTHLEGAVLQVQDVDVVVSSTHDQTVILNRQRDRRVHEQRDRQTERQVHEQRDRQVLVDSLWGSSSWH